MSESRDPKSVVKAALGGTSKRVIDLFGSLLLLIFFSPLLVCLAIFIALDGGKPIFRHTRVGHNGKVFGCLKFRSMVPDAPQVLQKFLDADPLLRAEWDRDFKLRDDPRVSKIGKFLRLSSLDELPQLWNVLVGDMSLVGPRPVVSAELVRYGDNLIYYLSARPGMTGLWQVSGRNNLDYSSRVRLDVFYVKNWSFRNDAAIVFRTFTVVLFRDGAC